MKTLNKSTIIITLTALIIGLGLGWIIFSNGNEVPQEEHKHTTENAVEEWTCSMHPQIRQKEPGDCPICGMDLIPVNTDTKGDENPLEVKMSPTAMQLASVQTALVTKTQPVKELRLTGKVQADESAVTTQTTHISGRVEKLLVNTTGEYVNKGQVIAYIYSPELVTAQKELFEAKKIASTNPQLLEAAEEKLKNWKLTNAQIKSILESGKSIENFPILADQNGIVLTKRVNLGDHVMQGAPLYEIANLSRVWVLFDIYESDMKWVKIGDEVNYTISSIPGKEFRGKINFIDPVINPKTRVAQARVVRTNTNDVLKPEMFATGIVNSSIRKLAEAIVVPKSAVMWTGKKSVVYIKTSSSEGVGFLMREIKTGATLGNNIVVINGLQEGEEIAINGTFSIDAAAQLAGKPSMMNPKGGKVTTEHQHGNSSPSTPTSHATNTSTNAISAEAKAALHPIYNSYLAIKEALANDDLNQSLEQSKTFEKTLNQVSMSFFEGDYHHQWMSFQSNLKKLAKNMIKAEDIEGVRNEFQGLSEEMIALTKAFDQPYSHTLFIQHCPMAQSDKGANWLSAERVIRNPYFGASMLKCGEIRKNFPTKDGI